MAIIGIGLHGQEEPRRPQLFESAEEALEPRIRIGGGGNEIDIFPRRKDHPPGLGPEEGVALDLALAGLVDEGRLDGIEGHINVRLGAGAKAGRKGGEEEKDTHGTLATNN